MLLHENLRQPTEQVEDTYAKQQVFTAKQLNGVNIRL